MDEKKCNVCKGSKPLSEFYKHKQSPDGVGYTCKACSRTRSAKWNTDHPERVRGNNRKSWANRADQINEKRRERSLTDVEYQARRAEERRRYYEKHRELEAVRSKMRRDSPAGRAWRAEYLMRNAERQRAVTIKRKYGIAPEQYDAMLAAQNGACAICRRESPLTVDHDHSCCDSERSCGDCVRGLLCNPCNRALGFFGDDLGRLQSAVQYLREPRPAIPQRPSNTIERAVWEEWGSLPEGELSPVKRIAERLGITPSDVAFTVYPAETFGRWADNQEDDI